MQTISREQVLAYRAAAQGLHRSTSDLLGLAVLAIGVQDSGADAAQLAFDARLARESPIVGVGPGEPLALVWSLRGAPHVHRRADLDAVAGALYPLSEADAAGRLNETGPSVARAGITAVEQCEIAARELKAVVRGPTDKGAASAAVTQRIPPAMQRNCRACKAMHISDSAMRTAALIAGLELQPGTSPPVLQPRPHARIPKTASIAALRKLITAYLTLLGPASQADVAGYLGARRADIAQVWPDGLVEVCVDGREVWLPEAQVGHLTSAPEPDVVRLLGGFDPWLQARDRNLIVPDTSIHKSLWPVLGRPGTLFVDGEIVGIWRTKSGGAKSAGAKLTLTVESFAPLPDRVWAQIKSEAYRIGNIRGAGSVDVKRVD